METILTCPFWISQFLTNFLVQIIILSLLMVPLQLSMQKEKQLMAPCIGLKLLTIKWMGSCLIFPRGYLEISSRFVSKVWVNLLLFLPNCIHLKVLLTQTHILSVYHLHFHHLLLVGLKDHFIVPLKVSLVNPRKASFTLKQGPGLS